MRNSAHEASCIYQMVFKPTKLIGNFSHGICNGMILVVARVGFWCTVNVCSPLAALLHVIKYCFHVFFFSFFPLLSARLQRSSSLYAFVSYLGSVAKFHELNVKSMLYFSLRCTTCKVHFSIVDLVACKSNGHVFFGAFAMKIAYWMHYRGLCIYLTVSTPCRTQLISVLTIALLWGSVFVREICL